MIFVIEAIVLCALFTLMVIMMAKDPVKTLYNYPSKIQERVKFLECYKDKIPTQKNKITAKLAASVLFIVILSLVLRYVNGLFVGFVMTQDLCLKVQKIWSKNTIITGFI